MKEIFRKFAELIGEFCGSPTGFVLFLLAIVISMVVGFIYDFSDTWQTIFDIGTNILFLLLLLLMQNTQNRESKIIHLKLNELLRAIEGARTGMVNLENQTDEDLERLAEEFARNHPEG